jgi:hypothetical protein
MGRSITTDSATVLSATGQSTNINGNHSTVEQLDIVSYDCEWENGALLNAELFIEYRNSEKDSWKRFPITPAMTMNAASGAFRVDIEAVNYKQTRPAIDFIAGSCDITITVKGTTLGA